MSALQNALKIVSGPFTRQWYSTGDFRDRFRRFPTKTDTFHFEESGTGNVSRIGTRNLRIYRFSNSALHCVKIFGLFDQLYWFHATVSRTLY